MSDNKKMMEIAEKIIKEYSKDFNTDIIDMYRIDFDNMKALCDKEFEKNGIKTDYEYQSTDVLSQKRDFMVLDAYVKGESDRYKTPYRKCNMENIVKYAANYEKEVSDGERKPTLEQTGRLAKLYKREMKKDMDDLLKIADARSFAERMDKYIAENSSKNENVQQAYKAIDDFIYEKIPENEFDKVMQSQTPETIKDAFDKVIEDMGTIPFEYPEYDGSYGRDVEIEGDFRAPAVLHIYENYIKDNIKDISKESVNIKAIDSVSKDTKEYEQVYGIITEYVNGKRDNLDGLPKDIDTKIMDNAFYRMLNETRCENDEVKSRITDICQECQLPRMNSRDNIDNVELFEQIEETVAENVASTISEDKNVQSTYKEMYRRLHNSHIPKIGEHNEYRSMDFRDSHFDRIPELSPEEQKTAETAFLKLLDNDVIAKKLLDGISDNEPTAEVLNYVMNNKECNFYDLINVYEMSGARDYIIEGLSEEGNTIGLTKQEASNLWKVEQIIDAESEFDNVQSMMYGYVKGEVSEKDLIECLAESEPAFVTNAFSSLINPFSEYYMGDNVYDRSAEEADRLYDIYNICDLDNDRYKEAFENTSFYHYSEMINMRNFSRATDEVQKWMSDPDKTSAKELYEAIGAVKDNRAAYYQKSIPELASSAALRVMELQPERDTKEFEKLADIFIQGKTRLTNRYEFGQLEDKNPEAARNMKEIYRDGVKEKIANEFASNAKWDVKMYSSDRYEIDRLGFDKQDKADIIAKAINNAKNMRVMGNIDISKKDMEFALGESCDLLELGSDEGIDMLTAAAEKYPQISEMADNVMKVAAFKDMVRETLIQRHSFEKDIAQLKDDVVTDKQFGKIIKDINNEHDERTKYGDKLQYSENITLLKLINDKDVANEVVNVMDENKFRCDDSSERESAVNEAKAYVEERFGVSKDEIDVSDNHDDFNDYDDYDEL